jgi:hypothetical protein
MLFSATEMEAERLSFREESGFADPCERVNVCALFCNRINVRMAFRRHGKSSLYDSIVKATTGKVTFAAILN